MLVREPNENSPLLQSQRSEQILTCSTSSSSAPGPSAPCSQRLRHVIANITVEPVLFLHGMSFAVASVFYTNMMVDKVCQLQLNYTSEVCKNLDSGDYTEEQNAVQRITSQYQLYCSWIENCLGVFVMIILGAWGDTYGRKIPLLVPMIGDALKAFLLLANAYCWYWKPYFIILAYIPYGLGGSAMAIYMAAYAFVGNHSGDRSRTTRLSLAGLMMYAASPAGHFIGTVLYIHGGYVLVFGSQFLFSILAVIYVLARFDSSPPPRKEADSTDRRRDSRRLTLQTVKKSLMVVMKPREENQRAHIIAHILCIWITMVSYEGSIFTYLYTRKKFSWNYYSYIIWSIVSTPVSFVASCIILPILSYHFQLEDSLLGFIGSSSHIFYGVIVGTAPVSWLLYLAMVISSFSGMIITSSRGAISKLVSPDELGGVFSTIAIGEAIGPIVFAPMFTLIYNDTLDTFPGAVFIAGSFMAVVASCIYTWILSSGHRPDPLRV